MFEIHNNKFLIINRGEGKYIIERKFNNYFVINNWITNKELIYIFEIIENNTNNFSYISYQNLLLCFLKILLLFFIIFFIALFFNSSLKNLKIVCLVMFVLISSILFAKIKHHYKYKKMFINKIKALADQINTKYLNIKGINLEFDEYYYNFFLINLSNKYN